MGIIAGFHCDREPVGPALHFVVAGLVERVGHAECCAVSQGRGRHLSLPALLHHRTPQRIRFVGDTGVGQALRGDGIDGDEPALNLAATEKLRADLRKERLQEPK